MLRHADMSSVGRADRPRSPPRRERGGGRTRGSAWTTTPQPCPLNGPLRPGWVPGAGPGHEQHVEPALIESGERYACPRAWSSPSEGRMPPLPRSTPSNRAIPCDGPEPPPQPNPRHHGDRRRAAACACRYAERRPQRAGVCPRAGSPRSSLTRPQRTTTDLLRDRVAAASPVQRPVDEDGLGGVALERADSLLLNERQHVGRSWCPPPVILVRGQCSAQTELATLVASASGNGPNLEARSGRRAKERVAAAQNGDVAGADHLGRPGTRSTVRAVAPSMRPPSRSAARPAPHRSVPPMKQRLASSSAPGVSSG